MVIKLFTYVVACTSHYSFPSIYSQQGQFDSFSFQLLVVPLHNGVEYTPVWIHVWTGMFLRFGCSASKYDFFIGFREAEAVRHI